MKPNKCAYHRILEKSVMNDNGCLVCGYMKAPFGHCLVRWFNKDSGKWSMRPAHVMVYEWVNGSIPKGLVVRHECDNPACVNINHLLLGTQKDNVHDSIKRRRWPMNERHKWTKLSVDDVMAIRSSSLSSSELALTYNVTYRHIRHIVTGAERKYAS